MSFAADKQGDTRSRIVAVAARLLRDDGPAAVTTRAVAVGAGVQPPMIYRLFGDKDGLLEAVAEHVMVTFVSAKAAVVEAAAADDVDPLEDLRTGWLAQIEFGVANPTLFTFLSAPDRVQRSPAAQIGKRVLESRVHRVALTGRLGVSEPRAVDLIRAAGAGTVLAILSTPLHDRDPGLAEDMYHTVLNRILVDAPERAEDHATATIVAFRAIAPQIDALSNAERHLLTDWLDRMMKSRRAAPPDQTGNELR